MKLDHVNLTVLNVREAGGFIKRHFGYQDAFEDNNDGMAVLTDGQGLYINLMKGGNPTYPKMFHIGFDMGTEAEVNAMYARLTADGIVTDPPRNEWGAWSFHFTCPGATFVIEVACTAEGEQ